MVIENLQITPLAEWLLGAGWHNGWLWQPAGIAVLLALVLGGGTALIVALRRGPARPGPAASLCTGSVLGVLTLLVLAALAMSSTPVTRSVMKDYIGAPLANSLAPMLGREKAAENPPPEKEPSQAKDANQQTQANDWMSGALYIWLAVLTGLLGLIYFLAWLIAVLVGGPAGHGEMRPFRSGGGR